MGDSLKIQDILQKLKHLDCPLLGNDDDAWVKEILFTQNFNRYHLMEWIISKLEFTIPKGDECQNASEVKVKNLLIAMSALGLCEKENSDLIEGIAPLKEQLSFWMFLVDILWKKSSHVTDNHTSASIGDQYESQCRYINTLCNSVNFNALFKEKVQLFPPALLKESKEACSSSGSKLQSLEDFRKNALKSSYNTTPDWSVKNRILEENVGISHSSDSVVFDDKILNKLEDDMANTLSNLHNHASGDFADTYSKLKLYLDIPPDETIDVGPAFEATQAKSEKHLQLKNSLSILESSKIQLKNLNTDLEHFQISCEGMSDALLGEYIGILNEEKDQKK